jgi:polar amino acid transport system substrate-binding protein
MRTAKGVAALILAATFAAACSGGGASPSTAASVAPSAPPSAALEPSAPPTPDACAPDTLALKTAGKLTIGADNPAYPPFFEPSDTNTGDWELGDPTNGQGFESAVGYAIADEMGFTGDQVAWIAVLFNNAIQPGPRTSTST